VKRRLFNLAAAVSLVLCVAMVTLWVRSYRRKYDIDMLQYGQRTGANLDWVSHDLRSQSGAVVAWRLRVPASPMQEYISMRVGEPVGPFPLGLHYGWPNRPFHDSFGTIRQVGSEVMGFAFASQSNSNESFVGVIGPDWFLVAIFAALPAGWTIHYWRRRYRGPDHCSVCGYDLRATPERCPECGTVQQAAEGSAA
jgi:hypothetical protein